LPQLGMPGPELESTPSSVLEPISVMAVVSAAVVSVEVDPSPMVPLPLAEVEAEGPSSPGQPVANNSNAAADQEIGPIREGRIMERKLPSAAVANR